MLTYPLTGKNISPLALFLPCTHFNVPISVRFPSFSISLSLWPAKHPCWFGLHGHSFFPVIQFSRRKLYTHTHRVIISSLAILEGLSPYGDSVLYHAGQSSPTALSLWWQQLKHPSVTSKGATDEWGSHFSFFLRSISVFCGILTFLQCTS